MAEIYELLSVTATPPRNGIMYRVNVVRIPQRYPHTLENLITLEVNENALTHQFASPVRYEPGQIMIHHAPEVSVTTRTRGSGPGIYQSTESNSIQGRHFQSVVMDDPTRPTPFLPSLLGFYDTMVDIRQERKDDEKDESESDPTLNRRSKSKL